ncbi:helix-turn-helix domain-containing protein [Streptomyces sp. NPDC053427]|uniref:helix-turn-helix domain-containing protein n=1 Tax=Streptomyces sp. NPDC053427 TaxID=3365701 RepID=UPI0037D8D829
MRLGHETKFDLTPDSSRPCRYYGISRNCFYKWQRRYQEEGIEGLRDRSSAPHHSPDATDADIVNKIVYLRQNYHFGPMKIRMYLQRYHDIDIACSAVYRILKRLGLNRLPASQRYKRHDRRCTRYEKQLPGNRVQIDVKFIEPIGEHRPQSTAHPPAESRTGRRRRADRCPAKAAPGPSGPGETRWTIKPWQEEPAPSNGAGQPTKAADNEEWTCHATSSPDCCSAGRMWSWQGNC